MNPNAGEPVNPSGAPALSISPDIARVEDLVAVAKQEAAAPASPMDQFAAQFGSGVTTPPPVGEVPSSSMPNTNSSIPPVANISVPEQTQPVAEVLAKPEEDPQATFVQEIKDAVGRLEEATRKKTAV